MSRVKLRKFYNEVIMMEERDNIVVLTDEDGNEEEFEHIDTFDMNDSKYVVLIPVMEDDEFEEEGEIVFLRLEEDENGEEVLMGIEDEDELDEAFEVFKIRAADEYDFVIDDEE